ncbi:hypothetical protein Micbo1qcDRAFT_170134 [Microdochium bolleyi]|uniref:Uncharacterized protein n=1 Tax=Microdochium bolleyi TaxID=196109 RepID=A0A136JGJ8_9PEZI|nr:hypothetical protein Micbo1qcDRAFT_170134 [Microdochium bolleyi]
MRSLRVQALVLLPPLFAVLPVSSASKCRPPPSSGSVIGAYSTVSTQSLSSSSTSTAILDTSALSSISSARASSAEDGTVSSSASISSIVVTTTSSTVSVSSSTYTTSSTGTTSSTDTTPTITTTSSTAATTNSASETATSSFAETSTESSTVSELGTFDPEHYTFYEVTLPITFQATPSTVQATSTFTLTIDQTAPPSCVVDSSSLATVTLRLGDNAGNQFVPKAAAVSGRGDRIGVVEASDFPSFGATSDPGGTLAERNLQYFKSIGYKLVPASGGRYDLTTTLGGRTKFVGYSQQSRDVVLVDASVPTGSTGDVVTSVFGFSCEGRLSLRSLSGTTMTWRIGPDGVNTMMIDGTPDDAADILFTTTAEPTEDISPTATNKRRGDNSSRFAELEYDSESSQLLRRMSPFTDGWYPRLPSTPANMFSRGMIGARPMSYNGCGSGSTRAWIPQLGFGKCCNMHDYCYDNCATGKVELCNNDYCAPGQWESCNYLFYRCMQDTVCSDISWFWHPIDRSLCDFEAKFYVAVVSTYKGGDAFKEATAARCGAYCQNGAPFCGGGSRQCVSSTDDNNCEECGSSCNTAAKFACRGSKCTCIADVRNDNKNCGGCGNVCPFKTKCGGGSCNCVDDRCGNLCVDFKTHPRNCGACGVVCQSGFCWQGKCLDPLTLPTPTGNAPPVCLATDAVKNGGFDNLENGGASATSWFLKAQSGGASLAFVGSGNSQSGSNAAVLTTVMPSVLKFSNRVSMAQTITLCAGKQYELTFKASFPRLSLVPLRISLEGSAVDPIFLGSASWMPNAEGYRGYGPFPFTVPTAADGSVSLQRDLVFDVRASAISLPQYGSVTIDEVSIYQP